MSSLGTINTCSVCDKYYDSRCNLEPGKFLWMNGKFIEKSIFQGEQKAFLKIKSNLIKSFSQ